MRKTFLAIAALMLSGSALSAAPLTLDPSPSAQARPVVNVVFADYLSSRVGAQVETAVVDLDKDGVGDIVARFVHSASCVSDMRVCRTVVLRYDGTAWRIVFDHPEAQMEILPGSTGVPAPIRADRITWNWNYPAYAPTADGIGDRVELTEVPRDVVPSLAPAFGQGAAKLAAASTAYHFTYARPKLSDKDDFIAVSLSGPAACGLKTGCPVRLLKKEAAGWKPVLASTATSAMFVGMAERGGYRDLVVDTKTGFVVYGWNGQSYTVADRVETPEKGAK